MPKEHSSTYLLTSLLFVEFEERMSFPDTSSFLLDSWLNALASSLNQVIETLLQER
jgi:hypothetical protein